jgi:D-serine deaminase-like pyridoxal phosphate-dependent protein
MDDDKLVTVPLALLRQMLAIVEMITEVDVVCMWDDKQEAAKFSELVTTVHEQLYDKHFK